MVIFHSFVAVYQRVFCSWLIYVQTAIVNPPSGWRSQRDQRDHVTTEVVIKTFGWVAKKIDRKPMVNLPSKTNIGGSG
jgi:hypothetical protein